MEITLAIIAALAFVGWAIELHIAERRKAENKYLINLLNRQPERSDD